MNKLEELIKEYCPDGVEYKELSEFLKIKNGSDYKELGMGDIPVYGSGGIMTYVDKAAYDKPSVLIPRKGSIDKLYYVDTPFWNVDTIFYTEIDITKAIPRYVYHCLLREHLEQYNTAGGVPSLTQKVLNKVKIPLPPLEVQHEIVKILDNYTASVTTLQQELEAELTARRKQYEYYRDKLLSFDVHGGGADSVEWRTLGEVCNIKGRIGFRGYTKNDMVEKGQGAISLSPSNIVNHTLRYGNDTYISWEKYNESPEIMVNVNDVLFCKTGSTLGKTAIVDFLPDKATINPQLVVLKNIKCNNRYLKYFLTTYYFQNEIQKRKGLGSVPNISQKEISEISIPIPNLEIQERIADVLDNFEKICSNLSIDLPAEIEARQKQYEYYRDALLSFDSSYFVNVEREREREMSGAAD